MRIQKEEMRLISYFTDSGNCFSAHVRRARYQFLPPQNFPILPFKTSSPGSDPFSCNMIINHTGRIASSSNIWQLKSKVRQNIMQGGPAVHLHCFVYSSCTTRYQAPSHKDCPIILFPIVLSLIMRSKMSQIVPRSTQDENHLVCLCYTEQRWLKGRIDRICFLRGSAGS